MASRINEIANNSEVSEKAIEKYLVEQVKRLGGIALKYDNPHEVGYPDRIVILPNVPAFWVELKSRGKNPRAIQICRHETLRHLGQKVYVVDRKEQIDEILNL